MSQRIREQGGHLVFFFDRPENTNRKRTLRSSFLSGFAEFYSSVSEEESYMNPQFRGRGCHLVFPISPKNTNLVADEEIWLPVKFRRIPIAEIREELNMLHPLRGRGGLLVFPIGAKNKNLVDDVELLYPMDDGQRLITTVHLIALLCHILLSVRLSAMVLVLIFNCIE